MPPRHEHQPSITDRENDPAFQVMSVLASLGDAQPTDAQRALLEAGAENLAAEEVPKIEDGVLALNKGFYFTDPDTGKKTEVKPDLARRLMAYRRVPEENYEITLSRELVNKGEALVEKVSREWPFITAKRFENELGISSRESEALLEQLQISGHISYENEPGIGFTIGKFDRRQAPQLPKERSLGKKVVDFVTTERTRQTVERLAYTKKQQLRAARAIGESAVGLPGRLVRREAHKEKVARTQQEIDEFDARQREEEAKRQNPRWHTTIE